MDELNIPKNYRVQLWVGENALTVQLFDINMTPLTSEQQFARMWGRDELYSIVLDTLPERLHTNPHFPLLERFGVRECDCDCSKCSNVSSTTGMTICICPECICQRRGYSG